MQVQTHTKPNQDTTPSRISSTKRAHMKQNKKIKKPTKHQGKLGNAIYNKKQAISKGSESPNYGDYSESTQTQYPRLYYSDEHKPLVGLAVESSVGDNFTVYGRCKEDGSYHANADNYATYIDSQLWGKLREEVIQQREFINKFAGINL